MKENKISPREHVSVSGQDERALSVGICRAWSEANERRESTTERGHSHTVGEKTMYIYSCMHTAHEERVMAFILRASRLDYNPNRSLISNTMT